MLNAKNAFNLFQTNMVLNPTKQTTNILPPLLTESIAYYIKNPSKIQSQIDLISYMLSLSQSDFNLYVSNQDKRDGSFIEPRKYLEQLKEDLILFLTLPNITTETKDKIYHTYADRIGKLLDQAEVDLLLKMSVDQTIEESGYYLIGTVLDTPGRDCNIRSEGYGDELENVTALHCAVYLNYVHIAEQLIKHKANVDEEDSEYDTPLIYAASNGYLRMVDLLLEHTAFINWGNKMDKTALMDAVEHGHYEVVERLIDHDADIDMQDDDGYTALMYAAAYGHENIVSLLKEHGADLDCKSTEDETALMLAKKNKYNKIVDLLSDAPQHKNKKLKKT